MIDKRYFLLLLVTMAAYAITYAQPLLSIDSCRTLALQHNKQMLMAKQQQQAAHYTRRAAFTNFLPKILASGSYLYTHRELSLLNDGKKELLGTLAELLRTDTRNLWIGRIQLTQPLYMGGKIAAYYRITRYEERIADEQTETQRQETLLNTDEAYWLVISLAAKKKLAENYLQLVSTLESDVQKMVDAGIATRADKLSVTVKSDEAALTLTEATDGLRLSRMALCQLCGLPLDSPIRLYDEEGISEGKRNGLSTSETLPQQVDMALKKRPELQSLRHLYEIRHQQVKVARADYLPTIALTGGYMISNPSLMNGFERKFNGTWFVGAVANIPLWNWSEGLYKVREARAQANITHYELAEAEELIALQVHQAVYKVNEAHKRLAMTEQNVKKAAENLHYAQVGFREGITSVSSVMEAQTSWLSAHTEQVDALIGVKLADARLRKAKGE